MGIGDNLEMQNGFGAARFPIDPTLVDDTDLSAAAIDPGHDAIIQLLKAAINADLGDVWEKLVGTLPGKHFLQGSHPVQFTLDDEPNPAAGTQMTFGWPVLAVFPSGQPQQFMLTMAIPAQRQDWTVCYLIGPLDVAHRRKIGRAICRKVAAVIKRVIWCGYHPAYKSGERQFFGQFSEIEVTGINGPGVAEILDKEKNVGYYGIEVTLQATERYFADSLDEIEDPTNYGYVPAGTGKATDDWVEADTQVTADEGAAADGFAEANKTITTIEELPDMLPTQVTP